MDVWGFLGQLGNALFSEIIALMNTIMNGILGSIKDMVGGILNGFGIPFSEWAYGLASQGYTIPILFVAILGIAFLILMIFIDVFGLEKTVGKTIGGFLKGGIGEELTGLTEKGAEL